MTVVDLFSGAGGLSCGLELAGFKPILANEINKVYANTYKNNHPDTIVVVEDIRNISETEFLENHGIKPGTVDLLAGGPPCQGFSVNAPIRSLDDPRNHLFKEFLRIASKLLPKAIVIENVLELFRLAKELL